jgi:transposase
MVIDGAMNGGVFRAWVRPMLAPSLGPGNIVVMDNLPAHKVGDDREMIETRGTRLLYLPPCSPDFNPIEQAFAKLKALLRKVAARTLKPLETAIADALDAFDPDECANSFTAAGHEPDRSETALEAWRRFYNEDRPHSAVGYNVPASLTNHGGACGPPPRKRGLDPRT